MNLAIYIAAFFAIWIGAGLAIKTVERLSRGLGISSFAISFLVLGLFTSVSETSVGINSVLDGDPEIYVGNLIGATIVLFILVLPLLAVIGHNIHVKEEFRGFNLIVSLVVVALPVLLSLDGKVGKIDSIIAAGSYIFLVICIEASRGLKAGIKKLSKESVRLGADFLKILIGVTIIFIASKFVVDKTIYFSQILNVTPFVVSLLVISIGTNIPEISLVFKSIFERTNQVAFGDYIGSAAFNTFLFGTLTLWYGKTVYLTNSYLISLGFLIVGLLGFYFFAKSKNTISRFEGFLLLLLYVAFVGVELFVHGWL